MECLSFCIADSIDLSHLDNYFKQPGTNFAATRFRDVLRLSPLTKPNVLVFIFKNGTVVSWGVKRHQIVEYLNTIRKFANKPITFSVHDEFSYREGNKTAIEPHDYFDVDCLTINTDMDLDDLMLSLSYGFSQSAKLQYFETILEVLIDKYNPWIQQLSIHRTPKLSRKQIRAVIGEILVAKSEMNLLSNFLYHPKYFWQHPILEEYYIMLERYLHIQRRINAINHRLDTLNEIFDMMNDYLESCHAHYLEIIIIVLIAIEIIFGVLNFHF